jgi:hypothetical protein
MAKFQHGLMLFKWSRVVLNSDPRFYSYHEEQLTGRQWIPMHAGVCVVVQQCLMGKRDHVCLNKGGLFLPGRPVETLGSCLNLTWLSPWSSLSFSFAYSDQTDLIYICLCVCVCVIDFFFLSICTAAKENIYYTWEPQLIEKIRAGHAQGRNNSIHGHGCLCSALQN